ncbi:MAG: cytochrome c biogenesis protein ResB [Chloroflexi bacterium]|nr:cytochrome c biogenesis protein ResB [Chloroflexota bacterium]
MAEQSVIRGAWWWRTARLMMVPLWATWQLLISVRWAIGLIAFLALAGLLGVIVPQVPANVRGDALAEVQWLAVQEGRFGFLTDPMNRLGFFEVFHARWFIYALGLLAVSLAVWVVSYFPSIWRAITRPRKRVNDAYFASARHRFDYATPAAGSGLESVLRRQRYTVERYQEGDTTYLFADRFQFAQLATFATHVAVVVLLAGGLVSWFSGFSNGMMIAEGSTGPVFPLTHPNQMQVELVDAVGLFSPEGRALDYRSDLVIYQGGEEVKRCTTTVNSPCSYKGYRFHQAAYFGNGADVQVRDLASGNVIYRETITLSSTLPSPRVVVRDGDGTVLLDEALVLTDILSTDEFVYYGTLVTLPDDRVISIGARRAAEDERWQLAVFEPGEGEEAVRLVLSEGESASAGGLEFVYSGLQSVPAVFVSDLPLPPGLPAGAGSGQVLVEMSNVVYGTGTASEGTAVAPAVGSGPPELTIIGLQPQAVSLRPGESVEIGGYEYSFLGQREFAGIQVKKDRSDYLIWVGTALLITGLVVTFWVPRRRLWARITPTRTYLAGQAGHLIRLDREMEDLARQEGATLDEAEGQGKDD